MILTKNTVQIAAAEKYRSRSLLTDQRLLFTKMGAVRKYPCPGIDSTIPHLTRQSIYPAFSRAKPTMPKMAGSSCRPLPNHSLIMGCKIVCFFSFSHCVLFAKAIQSVVLKGRISTSRRYQAARKTLACAVAAGQSGVFTTFRLPGVFTTFRLPGPAMLVYLQTDGFRV